ncbi:histidine kinase [Streptomyces sp. ID05-04B]|uniref:sensor histidine kinase n=1 Tax=unclassified Streptomyces TaxID=2593676 RepID=UPI000D1B8C36|nr:MULTISPECIES: histidine kinase [unclassified Streptomyces]AVV41768.1 two-component sensor histidine kinase [Streptomyces sp. P3]MDX5570217.1 histidine kinase [Streptomyces sp. ID05-04B]
MRSTWLRGSARGAAVGALLAACVLDLVIADSEGSLWGPAVLLAVGLVAVLWPASRRPARLTPQLRTAVPALLSALYTAAAVVQGHLAPFGPGELAILLCLLFVAVRHCPPNRVVACAALDALAFLATPCREFWPPWSQEGEGLAYIVVGLVFVLLVGSLAVYLRSLDYRRTVAVDDTRREERLAIAADLHDFVAHHVTGILVQTQVARMMTRVGPEPGEQLDPVLAGIERAATEALASMRRTVGVLRDTPEADRRPVGDLAGITGLVENFVGGPGQQVALHRSPTVSDDLPHEVQAAAFRVVQEALTNVRRHAADASAVTVRLGLDGERLDVTVVDDGHGGAPLPAEAHGGGFGLVGLRERVTALGGDLSTGPLPSGHGWQVRALFPAR